MIGCFARKGTDNERKGKKFRTRPKKIIIIIQKQRTQKKNLLECENHYAPTGLAVFATVSRNCYGSVISLFSLYNSDET